MFRFDDSDPQFVIIYTGDKHALPDDYRQSFKFWAEQLKRRERFGVIMVDEPHEHPEGESDEDHRQHEAEFARVINDFRRDYRESTSQQNVGYARVMPLAWNDLYFSEAGSWDRYVLVHERYTQYNWGIPGGLFFDLEQAKAWIRDQFNNAPVHSAVKSEADAAAETAANAAAKRVGLFYGSSSGVTEYIAEKIQAAWSAAGMQPITAVNIGTVKDLGRLLDYDYLLLGVPTWNIGQLQDDWDILFPQLDRLDFSGKHIAMFGIGDQQNYAENFLDALGILGNKLIERGATLVGYWNDGKYEFTASRGFVDGKFMGLGIDEEQQAALTAQRIQQWVAQVAAEFKVEQVALSE